jgi:hypothetical protein
MTPGHYVTVTKGKSAARMAPNHLAADQLPRSGSTASLSGAMNEIGEHRAE